MKFYELVLRNKWEDVGRKILELYPDQMKNIKGYEEAYFELRNPIPILKNDSTLYIEHIDDGDDSYEDLYLLNDDDTRYAVDFVAWGEVLGMDIAEETIEKYSALEIIAHVLFEITFYGYSDRDVSKKREELFSIIEDVKKEYDIS